MSDAPTPPEERPPGGDRPPGFARRRLPFDENAVQPGGGFNGLRAAAYLYVGAAVVMGGIALFMAFGQGREWMHVSVLGPGLGAIYFTVRAIMTFRPRA